MLAPSRMIGTNIAPVTPVSWAEKNRTAYRLGDRVEVEIKSVDYYRQQIDLVTVRGGSDAVDADFEE